jgi:outer membrane protein TolC
MVMVQQEPRRADLLGVGAFDVRSLGNIPSAVGEFPTSAFGVSRISPAIVRGTAPAEGRSHRMRRLLFGVAIVLVSTPTLAQDAIPTMSLPDAIAHAREHHPAVRAALARVAAQKATAAVPRSQWLPTFGVTAQIFGGTANNTTASYVGQPFMDIPRIGGTRVASPGTFEPSASTFAGVGGTQEIFDFGRIAAQSAAEDALVDVEKQRARDRTLDVAFDVREAYFAVFAARSIVKSSDDAYERARAHRDLAKAGVDAGLRPPIELTRAEAELAKFDIARTSSRGGLSAAQAVLAAAVGFDGPALDTAPTTPEQADVVSLTEALRLGDARDPRVLEAKAHVRAEEEHTRAIGAELRPDLSFTATFSGRAGGAPPSSGPSTEYGGWVPYIPNWDVGLVFSWPLFDGTVLARKSASRAREDVRREELAAVRVEAEVAVREAWVAVDVARATLPALERALRAAEANYVQADARFKSGMGTSIELADAENMRATAEVELALGTFKLARARASLGRAIAEGM